MHTETISRRDKHALNWMLAWTLRKPHLLFGNWTIADSRQLFESGDSIATRPIAVDGQLKLVIANRTDQSASLSAFEAITLPAMRELFGRPDQDIVKRQLKINIVD